MGRAWQNYEPVSLRSLSVDSVDVLRTPIGGASIEVVQLGPGRLSGRLTRGSIGDLCFSKGAFSLPIRATGAFSKTNVTIGVLLSCSGSARSWTGAFVAGDTLVTPAGADHHSIYTGAASFAALSLAPSDLAAMFAGEAHLSEPLYWSRRHILHAPAAWRRTEILKVVRAVSRKLAQQSMVTEQVANFWRRSLVEVFVGDVACADGDDADAVIPSTARVVRDVEHYVDAKKLRPVHVSEICAHLNISRRTLHRSFSDVLGIGPGTYLRYKRLCAVHSRLRRPDKEGARVTEAATEFGFLELGRFSQQYKQLFGEYPNETLRRHAC
jgi:AraC-like DNA-binding protein